MAQNLVLIRHGKAQPFKSDADDASRILTPAGKRALRAVLPESLASLDLLPEFLLGEVEVWSSPAVRALETAQAAAAMLEVDDIVAHQSLYDQDFDAFMEELGESSADVVVAVGHEPFLGVVAERLCGVALPYKTASMAAFDLEAYEGEPKDSVLRHFCQGPRTERWKNLVKLEGILCNGAARVEETMALFLENPQDIEALHDFRVSIRTLRSEISFLKPYMDSDQAKRLQTGLRDLVVKTSRLRELDVLSEVFAAAEQPNEELVALVDKLRRKECDALIGEIGTKKAVKRACKLLDKVERVEWKQHVENGGLGVDDLLDRFDLIQLKFEAAYLKADYSDVEQTHDLRKAAKRVRYASREFGVLLGEAAQGVPEAMRDLQDELGALCDARVNCDIIDSLPRRKMSKSARAALDAIRWEQEAAILKVIESDSADDAEFQAPSALEGVISLRRTAEATAFEAVEAAVPEEPEAPRVKKKAKSEKELYQGSRRKCRGCRKCSRKRCRRCSKRNLLKKRR